MLTAWIWFVRLGLCAGLALVGIGVIGSLTSAKNIADVVSNRGWVIGAALGVLAAVILMATFSGRDTIRKVGLWVGTPLAVMACAAVAYTVLIGALFKDV